MTITVNDEPVELSMKLGYSGEAFFVTETFALLDQLVPLAHLTSPPPARASEVEIPGDFALEDRATPVAAGDGAGGRDQSATEALRGEGGGASREPSLASAGLTQEAGFTSGGFTSRDAGGFTSGDEAAAAPTVVSPRHRASLAPYASQEPDFHTKDDDEPPELESAPAADAAPASPGAGRGGAKLARDKGRRRGASGDLLSARQHRRAASGDWYWGGFPEYCYTHESDGAARHAVDGAAATAPSPVVESAAATLGSLPSPVKRSSSGPVTQEDEAAWEEGEALASLGGTPPPPRRSNPHRATCDRTPRAP